MKGTGVNDDLNGIERKVTFPVKDMNDSPAEVVNSLAKWKRMALADYCIPHGNGIYTDMNAVRPDEELSNIHSLYVDQWDWERVMARKDRNLDFLKYIVRKIYEVFKRTEYVVYEEYSHIKPVLPHDITFFHTEELLMQYPNLTPREREFEAVKKHGAIFVIGIGGMLANGESHDGRAPDYDDWSTPTVDGFHGLNGDIILWNPVLGISFEVSSMGIRVDRDAMLKQLELTDNLDRRDLMFHKRLISDELPLSIGGGIGQSRICMYYLRKAHIGEVQSSVWPASIMEECRRNNIFLL
jgi:aspartate--ammonia ligase